MRESGLTWAIFRYADVPPLALRAPVPIMFEIPLFAAHRDAPPLRRRPRDRKGATRKRHGARCGSSGAARAARSKYGDYLAQVSGGDGDRRAAARVCLQRHALLHRLARHRREPAGFRIPAAQLRRHRAPTSRRCSGGGARSRGCRSRWSASTCWGCRPTTENGVKGVRATGLGKRFEESTKPGPHLRSFHAASNEPQGQARARVPSDGLTLKITPQWPVGIGTATASRAYVNNGAR